MSLVELTGVLVDFLPARHFFFFIFKETGSPSVAQAELELIAILLPLLSECWGCNCAPLHGSVLF